MKALVKREAGEGLWMENVPKPEPGPNDLLIKIRKTAICGTDVHIYNWDEWAQATIKTPMTIGHEFVGEVAGLGSAVQGWKLGERVSGEGHITCHHCRNCRAGKKHLCRNAIGIGVNRTGAFGEYLVLPQENAFRVPNDISDDIASIFDPFGNATHTALSFDLVGEDVLITGAGPIGLMAAAVCRHVGARDIVITDINDARLDMAKAFGVTRAVNPSKQSLQNVMQDLGMTEGFDVALEMSGSIHGLNDILNNINYGGRIALLGIIPGTAGINWGQFVFKGLQMKGIYGREVFETWYKMQTMLQSGLRIGHVITHHFPVDKFLDGFAAMRSGTSGKVILEW